MRLAFVSPLPPASTGIADYAADLLRVLAPRHAVDVFHAQVEVDTAALPDGCEVHASSALQARHRERAYDLVVYQMGNGDAHAFVYPLLPRLPGLLVLHDLVLFHARARTFLDSPEVRRYAGEPGNLALRDAARPVLERWRAELVYAYPGQGERLYRASLDTVGRLLPYAYPMFRLPVEAARAVAVHNGFMAGAVREAVPGVAVHPVPMPVPIPDLPSETARRLRRDLGFAADDVVVGAFGRQTPEKELETLARALARARVHEPRLRFLLVGPVPDPEWLQGIVSRHGLSDVAAIAGRVPLEAFPAYVAASDVVAQLRYPTARETSAALLRVLALGRATVVSDVENLAEIPEDAVVRADLTDEEGALTRALLLLAAEPRTRERLGAAARAFVATHHAPERCAAPWDALLEKAAATPPPPKRPWPKHWLEPAPTTTPQRRRDSLPP